MGKIISMLLAFLIGVGTLILTAIITGTVIWFVWKLTIPHVFPKLVSEGYIAAKLTWLQAYGFSFLISMLMPSASSKRD